MSRIERALLSRSVRTPHVRYDPKLDPLRGHPGFREMLTRRGLGHLLPPCAGC